MAKRIDVDEAAGTLRIKYLTSNFTHLIANGKHGFGGGVVAKFRLVNFQPQALRALAVGDDLGFG